LVTTNHHHHHHHQRCLPTSGKARRFGVRVSDSPTAFKVAVCRKRGSRPLGGKLETPLKSPLDPTWKVSVAIRDSAAFEAKKWKCISDTLAV
jgi:hypothetical protein